MEGGTSSGSCEEGKLLRSALYLLGGENYVQIDGERLIDRFMDDIMVNYGVCFASYTSRYVRNIARRLGSPP